MLSSPRRLLALDVFRGLTIALMVLVNTPGSWSAVFAPFLHAPWHGCTLTDLVFPNFLFIVGVSLYFSLSKYDFRFSGAAFGKIAKRTALIFLIGVLLNWFPFYHQNIADLRIHGVLQRIALAYGLAATLALLVPRGRWPLLIATLLLGYWALLYFGGGADPYGKEDNLKRLVDLATVGPDHMYDGFGLPFDPEGLLGLISGAATALLGAGIGGLIRDRPQRRHLVRDMCLIGAALVGIGLLWNLIFPINKPLWTSSYVCFAGGIATLTLALCIELIDARGYRAWTAPFVHFGTNPLVVYVFSGVIVKLALYVFRWENAAGKSVNLYGWLWENVYAAAIPYPKVASLAFALSVVFVCWLLAVGLYRRRVFVKL